MPFPTICLNLSRQCVKKFCDLSQLTRLSDAGVVVTYHATEDFDDAELYYHYETVAQNGQAAKADAIHSVSEPYEPVHSIPFHNEMRVQPGYIDLVPYLVESANSSHTASFYRLLEALQLPKGCQKIYFLPIIVGSSTLAHWLIPTDVCEDSDRLIQSWEKYINNSQHYLLQDLFWDYLKEQPQDATLHDIFWRFSAQVVKAYTVKLPDVPKRTFCSYAQGDQPLILRFSDGKDIQITYSSTYATGDNTNIWSEQHAIYEIKSMAEKHLERIRTTQQETILRVKQRINKYFADWQSHRNTEREHINLIQAALDGIIPTPSEISHSTFHLKDTFQLNGRSFDLIFNGQRQSYEKFYKAGFAAIYVLIKREHEDRFFSAADILNDEDYRELSGKKRDIIVNEDDKSTIKIKKDEVAQLEAMLKNVKKDGERLKALLYLKEAYWELHRVTNAKRYGLRIAALKKEIAKISANTPIVPDYSAFVKDTSHGYREAHHINVETARKYNNGVRRNIANFLTALDQNQELYKHLDKCLKRSGGSATAPFRYIQTEEPKRYWDL